MAPKFSTSPYMPRKRQLTGEEEDFDPHVHRKVHKPTSYMDTMIHMLKGSIGAGILAMPEATRRLGIIWSTVGLILVGAFATYCIQLLIGAQYEMCKRWRVGYMAYPKSLRLSIREGPPFMRFSSVPFYYFVDVVLVIWQLGACCIYFVFVAQNVKQVLDFYGTNIDLRVHLCILLIPTIAVNLIKDLKLMTPMSTLSNIVITFGLIIVFFYLIEDDLEIGEDKLKMKNIGDIPVFIGTALFALEAVGVVLALEYNMENPRRFVGLFGLFNIGMAIIVFLYLVVGTFGYLKYGDTVTSSIILNLPQDQKKAQTAKILFAIAVFFSFPLQNFVAYSIIWRKIEKKLENKAKSCLVDYSLRVILVLIPWVLAVSVPKLGPFIALFGAFCLSLLAMVLPAILDLCVWYPVGYGPARYKLIRDVSIFIIERLADTVSVVGRHSDGYEKEVRVGSWRNSRFKEALTPFFSLLATIDRCNKAETSRSVSYNKPLKAILRNTGLLMTGRSPPSDPQLHTSIKEKILGREREVQEAGFLNHPPAVPVWLVTLQPPVAPASKKCAANFIENSQNQGLEENIVDTVQPNIIEERRTHSAQSSQLKTKKKNRSHPSLTKTKAAENASLITLQEKLCFEDEVEGAREWKGGLRALRDARLRLAQRQMTYIRRLNRALDRPPPGRAANALRSSHTLSTLFKKLKST